MEPLPTYDYLVRARARLLDWIRPLGPAAWTREFPFALRTLGATFAHIAGSEFYYVLRMTGAEVPPYETWRCRAEAPLPFAELEAEWGEQAVRTRAALGAIRDWSAELSYRVEPEDGPVIVSATAAEIFTQLAFHEVHHRAQALAMLAQMGVTLEGLDFNLMTYRRRPAT